MKEFELPKGWNWEKLDDALDFVIGGDWGKDENYEDSNYGLAYCIRGSEIKNWEEEKGKTASLRKIKLSNIEKRKLIEGDILVEISGGGPEQPVGRTVLIDKTVLSYKPEIPKICTNFLRLIRPKDYVEGKFLNLYLKLFYYSGEIVKYQGGSNNLRNLKFPDYVKINFPLPPKPTQQAIVSKIEELFSELDKGIENLHLAQQQLKTYRQAVLKWAFVNERFDKYSIADVTQKIQIGPFGTQLHKEDYIENGVPLINPTHIKDGLIVADKSFSILPSKRDSLPNYILDEGDVIMGRRGEMGRCGLVSKKEAGWFCGTGSLYFRPDKRKVNPLFLYYNLRSEPVKKYLNNNAGGTTMVNLNLKIVKDIPISIPSIDEQNKIVQEIESRLSVADKMEESISQSLQQAEALRQSILKKAFEGRLI